MVSDQPANLRYRFVKSVNASEMDRVRTSESGMVGNLTIAAMSTLSALRFSPASYKGMFELGTKSSSQMVPTRSVHTFESCTASRRRGALADRESTVARVERAMG